MFNLNDQNISYFKEYLEFEGRCNTEQGLAFDYYDSDQTFYSFYGYDYYYYGSYPTGTAADCLKWCRDEKRNRLSENWVACEYTDLYDCYLYKDDVITGGDESIGNICWMFISGKYATVCSSS